MSYKLGGIGTAAFQAFDDDGKELVFDLGEGVTVPEECKEGDEVEIDISLTRKRSMVRIHSGLTSLSIT